MTPLLTFDKVTVRLGPREVLTEIELGLEEGEFMAIVGPNGAGKTTLLRAALGLIPVTQGALRVMGAPVRTLTFLERARRLAWLPQSEGLQEDMTVEEFVGLGRYPHLGSFRAEGRLDREAVEHALSETDVARFRDRGILGLSGGERQRALLARSLAQEAPILLLDEPTNHLDMAYQLQVLQDLDRFRRAAPGRAVLVSLHDLNLASRFADRILWLKDGKKEVLGPPAATISSERVFRVFGVDVDIHQSGGRPYVYPPHQRITIAPGADTGPRVHVVCGGGSGLEVLRDLANAGFRLTAGALSLLDSDQEACTSLRVPSAVGAPFSELSEAVRAENRALMSESEAIVVAPLVVGPGNLANLLDLEGLSDSRPVFLVQGAALPERDFTGGRAQRAYEVLRERGAIEVSRPELVAALRRRIGPDASVGATV